MTLRKWEYQTYLESDEEPWCSKSFPNKRISNFRFQDYLLLKDQIDHYHLESESSTFVVDQSPHLDPMNTDEWLPTIFLAFEFDKNNQMNQMNPDKE